MVLHPVHILLHTCIHCPAPVYVCHVLYVLCVAIVWFVEVRVPDFLLFSVLYMCSMYVDLPCFSFSQVSAQYMM